MKKLNITKKFLIKEYIQNKNSMLQIAIEIGCSNGTVYNYLIKHNIPRRTIGKANKNRHYNVGEKASGYIDGRKSRIYFCKDCGKEISYQSGVFGQGRCNSCAQKINARKKWQDKDYREHQIKTILKSFDLKPNKPEKFLNKLLQKLLPKEYNFVGNGEVFITGFVPDFINCNGQKKIIELFGDYWHNREDAKKRDKLRLKTYKKYGYKTLVIWEHELKDLDKVKQKILEFNNV